MTDKTEVRTGEFRAIDTEARTADFVISTDAKDRHGTRMNMDNWVLDNYRKNPIVGYNHEVYGGDMCQKSDPNDIIGRGEVFFETARDGQKQLIGRVHFRPEGKSQRADDVFELVREGTLNSTSVGFVPVEDESGKIGAFGYVNERGEKVDVDTFYFHGQELLEFSIVNIPSNPEAVGKAIRSQTHNALLFVKDALGAEYSFSEIEKLRIGEVIDAIEKGTKPRKAQQRAEPDELEVGDHVTWNTSGGFAKGRVDQIETEGEIDVPDSDFTINASEEDPAALITVFDKNEDGTYTPTDTQVGHRFSALEKLDPLPMAENGNDQTNKLSYDTWRLLKIRERELELEKLNQSEN